MPFNPMENNYFNNIRNIYQTMMNSGNPMQFFTNMAMNNPQLKPILNLLNSGKNPQEIFYSMCNQRGINPQEFIQKIVG